MIRVDWIGLAALALIGMSACGGKSAQSGPPSGKDSQAQNGSDSSADAPSGGDMAALPACRWPAILDPVDGSTGQCVAARTVLSCQGSTGGGEGCLSDDPTRCPGPDPIVGETFSACKDQCNSDEYAVACGGPGPGPWPAPPSGCRGLPTGPGGGSLSCCRCGPTESLDSASDVLVITDDAGGSFACGSSTCDARAQVCEHVQGGAPPGVDFYACIPIPAACDHDVSCDCVTTALRGRGANQCSAAGTDVTVQIDVP
jgi:hypothetical protein